MYVVGKGYIIIFQTCQLTKMFLLEYSDVAGKINNISADVEPIAPSTVTYCQVLHKKFCSLTECYASDVVYLSHHCRCRLTVAWQPPQFDSLTTQMVIA